MTVEPVTLTPPTATPPFPEARLDDETVADIQLLRSVGLGGAIHAAIAPDNRLLAVATTAGVALFELPSLRHVRFDPIGGGASEVAFSDDGQHMLVTTGHRYAPQAVERRRVADGALVDSSPALGGTLVTTLLSPSGQIKATLGPPDSVPIPGVRLTRAGDDELIYADDETLRASFSADSSLAALVTYNSTVRVLDLGSGAIQSLDLPPIWGVAFSPDAQSLITSEHALRRWDVISGAPLKTIDLLTASDDLGLLGARQRIRYSADGSVLTVTGAYYVFEASRVVGKAWRADDLTALWESDAGGEGISNFMTYVGAISPATSASAMTDDGQTLELFQEGRPLRTTRVPAGIRALAFSPDGALLAVGDGEGRVDLVQVADGAVRHTLQVDAAVYAVEFSPDGALVGVESRDGLIMVWEVGEPRAVARIDQGPARPESDRSDGLGGAFLFTADHMWLIAWGGEGVRLYRLSDGRLVHQIEGAVSDAAIGPRRRLLALLRDGRVELWGVPEGGSQGGPALTEESSSSSWSVPQAGLASI